MTKTCHYAAMSKQGSPDEQSDGEGGGLLVRAGAGLDGEGSTKLGQHPGLGSSQALQVLLRTAGHGDLFFWN